MMAPDTPPTRYRHILPSPSLSLPHRHVRALPVLSPPIVLVLQHCCRICDMASSPLANSLCFTTIYMASCPPLSLSRSSGRPPARCTPPPAFVGAVDYRFV
jgi:hypothetical protein